MKASLRSVRIAPKKANLVAKMIRGLPVPEALDALQHTNKKAARIFEDLLKSAVANARHNDNQDPDILVVKTLVVNQAQAYHRGIPMARGRVRSIRKFLSHIDLRLGIAGVDDDEQAQPKETAEKTEKTASQTAAKEVKTSRSSSQTTKKSQKSTSGKAAKAKAETASSDSASPRAASAKAPKKAPAKSAAKKTSPKKS